jgi:hypothetical protein
VIHVVRGNLYELRMLGPPPSREFPIAGMEGPDLSALDPPPRFEERCMAEGSINVNEIGSIHQSFTRGDGATILCIWGGCHANISPSHHPVGWHGADVGSVE